MFVPFFKKKNRFLRKPLWVHCHYISMFAAFDLTTGNTDALCEWMRHLSVDYLKQCVALIYCKHYEQSILVIVQTLPEINILQSLAFWSLKRFSFHGSRITWKVQTMWIPKSVNSDVKGGLNTFLVNKKNIHLFSPKCIVCILEAWLKILKHFFPQITFAKKYLYPYLLAVSPLHFLCWRVAGFLCVLLLPTDDQLNSLKPGSECVSHCQRAHTLACVPTCSCMNDSNKIGIHM